MDRRRIGQERFGFVAERSSSGSCLVDWAPVERHLAVISCAAEALDDRASFRRFCGFSASEPTPERTAFVRFRKALVAHGLDRCPFEETTGQLKAKAIRVKTGTLVDATIIASARSERLS